MGGCLLYYFCSNLYFHIGSTVPHLNWNCLKRNHFIQNNAAVAIRQDPNRWEEWKGARQVLPTLSNRSNVNLLTLQLSARLNHDKYACCSIFIHLPLLCKSFSTARACVYICGRISFFIKAKLANIIERIGGLFLDCSINRLLLKELKETILFH